MKPEKRDQLLVLMMLDLETGVRVKELNNKWLVGLTGPRFSGQYVVTGLFELEHIAMRAGVRDIHDIPKYDLLRYYIEKSSEWAIRVMLDDYMNDNLYNADHEENLNELIYRG